MKCVLCDEELGYVEEYVQWYCYKCKKYMNQIFEASDIVMTTTETVPGQRIELILGIVKGVCAKGLKPGAGYAGLTAAISGQDIPPISNTILDCTNIATYKMFEEARSLKANAIVGVKYATTEIGKESAEMIVYGTAVITKGTG